MRIPITMGQEFPPGVLEDHWSACFDATRTRVQFIGIDPGMSRPESTISSLLKPPNRGLRQITLVHFHETVIPSDPLRLQALLWRARLFSMTPILNWREVAFWVETWRMALEGLFVERIFTPERADFPLGYLQNEWTIQLSGKEAKRLFSFCVRQGRPFAAVYETGKLRPFPAATQPVFGLALTKHLKGAKLISIRALQKERSLLLQFAPDIELLLNLIPALPEGLLMHREITGSTRRYSVLCRTRNVESAGPYSLPNGEHAPENPLLRSELVVDLSSIVAVELEKEAFALRVNRLQKQLRDLSTQARSRLRQASSSLQEARKEPDYRKLGDLLKGSFGNLPPMQKRENAAFRELLDFESGARIEVICDPKLTPQAQLEKFYSLARRKDRRIEEAEVRRNSFEEKLRELDDLLASIPQNLDWVPLRRIEEKILMPDQARTVKPRARKGNSSPWLGKSFRSKDDLAIWVGRSRDENMELTFKCARGNDLWMHVRGRPGAHVVIPIQTGTTVPLETLLDAAMLAVYYSGGERWGKTEVDYTFKKHVKRIKDSTEASYTRNKTLVIEPDGERLKRLLSQ